MRRSEVKVRVTSNCKIDSWIDWFSEHLVEPRSEDEGYFPFTDEVAGSSPAMAGNGRVAQLAERICTFVVWFSWLL